MLAAIWGASFLFMRLSIGEFGAWPLAALRVTGATLMLLPLLAWRAEAAALRRHWKPIAVVGMLGTALPFVLYGVAAKTLNVGVMSILNATTPMWGAIVAYAWFGDKLTPLRVAGLVIGFAGVLGLSWDSAGVNPGDAAVHSWVAIGACLGASLGYGFVAAFAKKNLAAVPPMAVAAGSQLSATLLLVVPAAMTAPTTLPGSTSWLSAVALAVVCTGLAYVLYFRLIANLGATNATTVTFLIPMFAMFWGWLLLNEPVTVSMVVACVLILLGTGLSTGYLGARAKA